MDGKDRRADYLRVQARFHCGSYTLTGTGRCASRVHDNVYRLTLRRGFIDRCIHWLLSICVPASTLAYSRLPPLWRMPSAIALKRLKPDWDDEFAHEVRTYERLKPLQGTVIPVCYGLARCDDGTPALVLSDVGGKALGEPEALDMDEADMIRKLQDPFNVIIALGFVQDDIKLDNFIWLETRSSS